MSYIIELKGIQAVNKATYLVLGFVHYACVQHAIVEVQRELIEENYSGGLIPCILIIENRVVARLKKLKTPNWARTKLIRDIRYSCQGWVYDLENGE